MIRSEAAAAVAAPLLAVIASSALLTASARAADPSESVQGGNGANVFTARCAVCHGPEAAGIPGSFPSLHEQVVAFAQLPQGRDYLVMVVTTGLMGELKVGGVTYRGVMPAQSGLSEAEVAGVLSYLASDRGKNPAAAVLTSADVADVRARHKDASSQTTRTLRPTLPEP